MHVKEIKLFYSVTRFSIIAQDSQQSKILVALINISPRAFGQGLFPPALGHGLLREVFRHVADLNIPINPCQIFLIDT